jgi:hypothetical protein
VADAAGAPGRSAWAGPLIAGAAVIGLAILGVGGWFVHQHLTFWDRDHAPRQLAIIDDDAALLRQDDVENRRVRVSRIDGNGTPGWGTVVDLPEGSSSSEWIAIPVPAARVATVGTLVGLSLDDGRELWRHPSPQRASRCRSFAVDE